MIKDKIHRLFERFVEIVFSLLFLLAIFPFIYIVVAVVAKRRSPGPAIVMRPRIQTDGKQFLAYRFRLRDEESFIARIPQIINILRGEIPIHINVSIDEGEPKPSEELEEKVEFIEPIKTNNDNNVNI